VYFLVGVRNRVSVMLDWFWAYLTYRPSTRLITGVASEERTPAKAAGPVPMSSIPARSMPAQQIDKAVTLP
jgi:NADH dehydrogenase/putative oxidoreductase